MQTNPNQMDLFGFAEPASMPAPIAPAIAAKDAIPTEAVACLTTPAGNTSEVAVAVVEARPILPSLADASAPILPAAICVAEKVACEAIPQALPATEMTLDEHNSLFARIRDGEVQVSPDEVRSSFERLLRDAVSVKSALGRFTVADLKKMLTTWVRDYRKPTLIASIFESMMTAYAFLTVTSEVVSIQGFTFEDRSNSIRRMLAGMTAETLIAYREFLQARQAQRREARAAFNKALENPETLAEFEVFIKKKGESALTPEQRACRDELVASKMRAEAQERKAAGATVEGVDLPAEMEIIETTHTRDKYPLFVVRLSERVDRAKFDELNDAAKHLGGRYSSFRGNGAVPGFQFKHRADAEQFATVGRGEAVSTAEKLAEREAQRESAAVEKLQSIAGRTKVSAEGDLNRDRLTNTAKRAGQASSAQDTARKKIALAGTMSSLGDAIASRKAVYLDRVTDKAQVEMLESMLTAAKYREIMATQEKGRYENRKDEPATLATIDYVQFPEFKSWAGQIGQFVDVVAATPGIKRLAAKFQPYVAEATKSGDDVVIPADLADACIARLGSESAKLPPYWSETQLRRKRLQRMGITTPEQFRAAFREYLQYREERQQADRATELERALVGQKVGLDFYPTSMKYTPRLVQMARPEPGKTWCEPSAGNGNIAISLREAGFEPDVVELSSSLREILEAKGFNVIGWDFLEVTQKYDRFVMNPPFSEARDILHVRHAYSLLNDDGVLVSIVGEGAFTRSDAQAKEFRAWLEELGADVEEVPDDVFTDRTLMQTTGAKARVVRIEKPRSK